MKVKIIDKLISIEAVKFGEFTLKSGLKSPVYIDLRILVAYPRLIQDIAQVFFELSKGLKYDLVAGIPYTALPIATLLSQVCDKPMIYCRKEAKDYGTAKRIEGKYEKGNRVLVVDDLITSGESKTETIRPFEDDGLVVEDVVVLIDRMQGGATLLEKAGYRLHSYITIFEILDRVQERGIIDRQKFDEVCRFLRETQPESQSG